MTLIKARHVGNATINGNEVGFFIPPHDEPDWLWVEVKALAHSYLPDEAATRMLRHSLNLGQRDRAVTTAQKGDSIVVIMCHAMAQGMCGAIDELAGHHIFDADWGGGPAETGYCIAAGEMMLEHCTLPISQLGEAFHNVGGPFMREMRDA